MYEVAQELAGKMRLHGLKNSLERRCAESLSESLHPSELVRLLLEDELLHRQDTKAKRLTAKAKFRRASDLENWDKNFERNLTPAKFKELVLLNFLHKKQSLLIIGATGLGKTQLAIAIGRAMCTEQFSVKFISPNQLFEEAAKEKAAGNFLKYINQLKSQTAIILDVLGLRNYTHDEAGILLEILEERYGQGVTIVTSQVEPEGWPSLFEDGVIGQAIVDRLINPSEKVVLKYPFPPESLIHPLAIVNRVNNTILKFILSLRRQYHRSLFQ